MRQPVSRRERLPDRRPNETVDLVFGGMRYAVTVGYRLDGHVGEVFTHGARVGSTMDMLLDDACVALSLLLQYGIEPVQLAASMGRLGDDRVPASIIGALAGLMAERSEDVAREVTR